MLAKLLVSRKGPGAGATFQIAIAPAPVLNFKLISGSWFLIWTLAPARSRQSPQLRLRAPGSGSAILCKSISAHHKRLYGLKSSLTVQLDLLWEDKPYHITQSYVIVLGRSFFICLLNFACLQSYEISMQYRGSRSRKLLKPRYGNMFIDMRF